MNNIKYHGWSGLNDPRTYLELVSFFVEWIKYVATRNRSYSETIPECHLFGSRLFEFLCIMQYRHLYTTSWTKNSLAKMTICEMDPTCSPSCNQGTNSKWWRMTSPEDDLSLGHPYNVWHTHIYIYEVWTCVNSTEKDGFGAKMTHVSSLLSWRVIKRNHCGRSCYQPPCTKWTSCIDSAEAQVVTTFTQLSQSEIIVNKKLQMLHAWLQVCARGLAGLPQGQQCHRPGDDVRPSVTVW